MINPKIFVWPKGLSAIEAKEQNALSETANLSLLTAGFDYLADLLELQTTVSKHTGILGVQFGLEINEHGLDFISLEEIIKMRETVVLEGQKFKNISELIEYRHEIESAFGSYSHAEEILSSASEDEYGDVRSMLDEYFPNVDQQQAEKIINVLTKQCCIDWSFDQEDGWGYYE